MAGAAQRNQILEMLMFPPMIPVGHVVNLNPVRITAFRAFLPSECETDGWQFTFIGANQDAIMVGGSIGISDTAKSALSMANTPAGVTAAFTSLSSATCSYRSTPEAAFCYSDADRDAQSSTYDPHQSVTNGLAAVKTEATIAGRKAGGKARAESLSAKQRSKIASDAAKARWKNSS